MGQAVGTTPALPPLPRSPEVTSWFVSWPLPTQPSPVQLGGGLLELPCGEDGGADLPWLWAAPQHLLLEVMHGLFLPHQCPLTGLQPHGNARHLGLVVRAEPGVRTPGCSCCFWWECGRGGAGNQDTWALVPAPPAI